MNKVYDAALQEKVRQFMAQSDMSQRKAAPMLGQSPASLNQWLKSKYDTGDVQKVESDIREFFKLQEERELQSERAQPFTQDVVYLPLSISENIYKFIKYCHITKGIMLVHGDAGIGKTKATVKYESENPSSTVYLESTPSTSGLRETLRQLAKVLRLPDNLKTSELSEQIKLRLQAGNKMLIIDEAQNLKFSTLEEITRWGDPDRKTGKATVSVVLIGNSRIKYRMEGKQEDRYKQQSSRIKYVREYHTSDIKRSDMDLLFPYLKEKRMEKELDFLFTICQCARDIRSATNLYENVTHLDKAPGAVPSYERLFDMAVEMNMNII